MRAKRNCDLVVYLQRAGGNTSQSLLLKHFDRYNLEHHSTYSPLARWPSAVVKKIQTSDSNSRPVFYGLQAAVLCSRSARNHDQNQPERTTRPTNRSTWSGNSCSFNHPTNSSAATALSTPAAVQTIPPPFREFRFHPFPLPFILRCLDLLLAMLRSLKPEWNFKLEIPQLLEKAGEEQSTLLLLYLVANSFWWFQAPTVLTPVPDEQKVDEITTALWGSERLLQSISRTSTTQHTILETCLTSSPFQIAPTFNPRSLNSTFFRISPSSAIASVNIWDHFLRTVERASAVSRTAILCWIRSGQLLPTEEPRARLTRTSSGRQFGPRDARGTISALPTPFG